MESHCEEGIALVKQVLINDTLYGPEEVDDHREQIIELRDHALKNNQFEWAIILSITVALLATLSSELNSYKGSKNAE